MTGHDAFPAAAAGNSPPASGMAGRGSASAGQLATARSSSPSRSHTSARAAPVASATILAIVGSSSSVA